MLGKNTLIELIVLSLSRSLGRPPVEIFRKLFNERHNLTKNSMLFGASSVALTSDILCGNAKEDYISVLAHYVSVF